MRERINDLVEYSGSSAVERASHFACDDHAARWDLELFRAVSIQAQAEVVYRWLCQLQLSPYSYDWIDNLGRRSPRELRFGSHELTLGQTFMSFFTLIDFEPSRSITLVTASKVFGRVTITYRIDAADAAGVRLVAKILVDSRRGAIGWLMKRTLPLGDWIMMRKQLLNLKALAERTESDSPSSQAS